MAQDSWPNAAHNSRALTDAEYEQLAARFSDDGVYGDPSQTAVVSAGSGLQVVVRANVSASVRGHGWTSGSVDFTLPVGSNTSGQTRIDRVVLRLDRSDWTVKAAVKAGTPGAGRPVLDRGEGSTGFFEVPLAEVTVGNNATSVTVQRTELYLGARIRPATSSAPSSVSKRGELVYEFDTGRLIMWSGSTNGWVTVYQDSGEVALGPGYSSWAPIAGTVGELKANGIVSLRIAVRRQESQFFAADPDGSKLCTIPASMKPNRTEYFTAVFGNGAVARVEVRSDLDVWCTAPSVNVPIGSTLYLTMTYFL
ncbi:hypothetical protein BX257_4729 [Streptomyces sp. 3212.3]|uniref:hypothetical protein n=1 Tax=Streptomyces sp. 3212.3 TaxID=1938846 RepID=UPI000E254ABE|nr:hypothetical protein [Streptomyces sp. 3212.3]REE62116.1 hypothetical protein BX257_4729 [Streptomyces sp. 3212.3]